MSDPAHAASKPQKDVETKLLGAHVEIELYWEFKRAAAVRQEELQIAIAHAARMYIDVISNSPQEG